MDRIDGLQTHVDALAQQLHGMTAHTRVVERRLRWWRGLAGGLLMLVVLTWTLPSGTAQEEASEKGQKGLAQRVAALEKLLKHFSREGKEIFITGANLHIVNGLGSTDCLDAQGNPIPDCPNGLGNLIVGYNELRNDPNFPDVRTGSHNVVVGLRHNFSRFGGLVVGAVNTISSDFAVVSGGRFNTASGGLAVVSGGDGNTASGDFSTVSGGVGNTASGESSTVSGGVENTASGQDAVVSAGNGNTASGELSTVSGGVENTANGPGSTVSGGRNRTAEGMDDWRGGRFFSDE